MKTNWKYFIPVIGLVFYFNDLHTGETQIAPETKIFEAYHIIAMLTILAISANVMSNL